MTKKTEGNRPTPPERPKRKHSPDAGDHPVGSATTAPSDVSRIKPCPTCGTLKSANRCDVCGTQDHDV